MLFGYRVDGTSAAGGKRIGRTTVRQQYQNDSSCLLFLSHHRPFLRRYRDRQPYPGFPRESVTVNLEGLHTGGGFTAVIAVKMSTRACPMAPTCIEKRRNYGCASIMCSGNRKSLQIILQAPATGLVLYHRYPPSRVNLAYQRSCSARGSFDIIQWVYSSSTHVQRTWA